MLCRVYCKGNGGYLLVPDCMVASREAERLFGPLHDCGLVDTREIPVDLRAAIQRDLDAQSFATLPAETVDRLGLTASRPR